MSQKAKKRKVLVGVVLDEKLANYLKDLAKRRGISVSYLCKQLILEALNAESNFVKWIKERPKPILTFINRYFDLCEKVVEARRNG